jgi:hypothetical protein
MGKKYATRNTKTQKIARASRASYATCGCICAASPFSLLWGYFNLVTLIYKYA